MSLNSPGGILISRALGSLWDFWESGPDKSATIARRLFDDLTEVGRLAPNSRTDLDTLRLKLEARLSEASPRAR
ncbi:MAG: hypothetical protein HY815_33600 [Candidatus Riflebacteria bacterium]|nr:hypothetical protein [Candidatus Riflebacteria bacterium]